MQNKTPSQNKFRIHSSPFRNIYILLACLIMAATFPSIVKASIAVIDTNNGSWDSSSWGTPMRVDGDDGGIADDHDIDTFWVNTDAASPTTYYFGLSTVATLSGTARICFKVDCNGDGDVTDAEDKVLEANPGDTYYDVNGNSDSPFDTNSGTDGEFVGRYVEAKTNTSGSISWASCMSTNPVIKAEVRDNFCPNLGTLYDETELREYNLPTTVSFRDFSAQTAPSQLANLAPGLGLPVAAILGGLVLLGKIILHKRK